MDAQRLRQIVYELPGESRRAQEFFVFLARLMENVEGSMLGGGQILIAQRQPAGLCPQTAFRLVNKPYPAVLFEIDIDPPVVLQLGNLILKTARAAATCPQIDERDHPAVGETVELPAGSEDFTSLLPLGGVYERLKDHVQRVDHTGVNIPAATMDRGAWDHLIGLLAGVSNLYRYPTGEDWPFVVPATADEFAADITEPEPHRRPKFELVYDTTLKNPLIQIDVETDLTRPEIEALFPAPYGVGLDGLDQYFRSVYVYHPWPGLSLRIDMGYRCEPPGDNLSGWLVREGGRIVVE